MKNPPFLDLFLLLRDEAGFSLTIDQYHMLIQALKGGFGISGSEDLKRICRLLWVKHNSSELERFNSCFDLYIEKLKAIDIEDTKDIVDTKFNPKITEIESENSHSKISEYSPDISRKEPSETPIAFKGKLLPEELFHERKYQLDIKDFPVTSRRIQQNWRSFRRTIREGNLIEIDIAATVDKICHEGFFLEPVLIPNSFNQAELLLLIDESNSMIPFELLSQKFVSTTDGRLGKIDTYYFRNIPVDYLYIYPRRPDFQEITELLPKLHIQRTVVLIISDAGAARGGINRQRIQLTEKFLEDLTPYVHHIAWLNPIPEERWSNTSAEFIAQLVHMYELNSSGLKAAIKVK